MCVTDVKAKKSENHGTATSKNTYQTSQKCRGKNWRYRGSIAEISQKNRGKVATEFENIAILSR
jgi:hypothetical protein